MSYAARKKYPAAYRYDSDDLPDRDAGPKREGFNAGMQAALDLLKELHEDYGFYSTIDYDAGHQDALKNAITRLSEKFEEYDDQ